MRRITLVWLLTVAVMLWLTSGALAVYQVRSLTDPANNWGWQTHANNKRCYNGKPAVLSWYNAGARGNAGPAPCANVGFETTESGSTGGTDQPGQTWVGTDRYVGVKLADIKKISYWAIVDWAGPTSFPLLDKNGNDVYMTAWDPRPPGYPPHWKEYRLQSMSSQPPRVVLIVKLSPTSDDWRKLIYRPWDTNPQGFGPSAVEFNATGTARIHRIWQYYTAVDTINGLYDGCWYATESADESHPTGMYTWEELVAKYPDAVLATPALAPLNSKGHYAPAFYSDPAQAPVETSFNLQMGAMANTNTDWYSVGKQAWWYESYWARGAADLVTFAYDADPSPEGENIIEETFDFEAGTPYDNVPLALNNRAIYDSNAYMPDPRGRPMTKPAENSEPWAGGTIISAGNYPWNAVQRFSHYGYRMDAGVRKGNLFVLYGVVTDEPVLGANNGYWFTVDDGSGKKIKCYCAQSVFSGKIAQGNYLRMVGSLQGYNPYEWYWNNFHIVVFRDTYPFNCPESQPWPWEFQTYTDWITVLHSM